MRSSPFNRGPPRRWATAALSFWQKYHWFVVGAIALMVISGTFSPRDSCRCPPKGSLCIPPLAAGGPGPFVEKFPDQGMAAVYRVRKKLYDSNEMMFDGVLGRARGQQRVRVFETGFFGRLLAIDQEVMLTNKDESHYHEMMAHVPLVHALSSSQQQQSGSHEKLRVLIVGGGDGGVMREVLKHDDVGTVTLVDIDELVVNVSKQYFPHIASGFKDPRAEVIIGDGAQYVQAQAQSGKVIDVAIVDSTDFNVARTLFTDKFYANMQKMLHPQHGILVFNVDSIPFATSTIADAQSQLSSIFKHAFIYSVFQPTYLSGHYGLLFASNGIHPFTSEVNWGKVWADKAISTLYYNPDMHYASFVLPNFCRRVLPPGYDDNLKLTDIKTPASAANMKLVA